MFGASDGVSIIGAVIGEGGSVLSAGPARCCCHASLETIGELGGGAGASSVGAPRYSMDRTHERTAVSYDRTFRIYRHDRMNECVSPAVLEEEIV